MTSKDRLSGNILHAKDSMTGYSPSDLRINLPDSSTLVTDVDEEEYIVSSEVSAKKIKRTNTMNMNNTENLNETKDSDIQPGNHRARYGNNAAIRRPSVTALGMNKLPNTDETNNRNLSVTQQNTRSTILTMPSNNAQVINASRIPRNKTSKTQRPRAASVSNVSTIHLDKSSIEKQTIADRSNAPTGATHGKANTSNGVVVTKISRKLAASQSYCP
jgi:hypothetical protein